ncbi:MAG: DUF4097 family beta strand repeat protein [Candidatus Krumholzibacteria bacterium]|nr:DUF4097 family beta strand repeat protein [Candidatus Krumholzibacteria bacterium]
MKKIIVLTLFVLLVGLLMSADLSAASKRRTYKEKVITEEFDLKPGDLIELDIETGGDIVVVGSDRDDVEVEIVISGRNMEDVEHEFDRTRSGLRIRLRFDRKFRRARVDTKVYLKVPSKMDIKFDTMGGDIEIEKVEGKISGKTMGGDIEFSRLIGEANVTTMGGDIRISDSELDGKVKTYGGDVRINDVVGNLRGSTMGGDVTYDGVKKRKSTRRSKREDDDEISISTLGGDLNLDYEGKEIKARTLGGDVDVKRAKKVKVSTMGGDIDIDEAPKGVDAHTMGGDITVESAGEYVKAKTMGGDIEIHSIDGWVVATTMGGDVTVRMVGDPAEGKRDVRIKSMGGDVEIILPDGLSIDFDVEIAYTKNCRKKCEIISDFPIQIEETEKWKRRWGQKRKYIYGTGEVDGGEHTIKIRTINGNVRIKKD